MNESNGVGDVGRSDNNNEKTANNTIIIIIFLRSIFTSGSVARIICH